jgi:hypothetical protein
MANLMPLVHQARRTIRNRQEGSRQIKEEFEPGFSMQSLDREGAAARRGLRQSNQTDCHGNRAPAPSSRRRGPGAAAPPARARRHVGRDLAGRTIIQLAVDDWTLDELVTFDAGAAEFEDGGDDEPDADDEEEGPPVVVDLVRPKVVRQARAFGQVD